MRERVLFIGTQFSILYSSMYSPAEAATPRAWCLWFRVSMHTGVHRLLASRLLVNPPFSGTLAFSLRLAPFLSASDSPALHTGSSASPSLAHSHFPGLAPPLFLLAAFSDTLASSLRLVPLPPAIGAPSLRPGSSAPSPTTPRRVGPSPPTAHRA